MIERPLQSFCICEGRGWISCVFGLVECRGMSTLDSQLLVSVSYATLQVGKWRIK